MPTIFFFLHTMSSFLHSGIRVITVAICSFLCVLYFFFMSHVRLSDIRCASNSLFYFRTISNKIHPFSTNKICDYIVFQTLCSVACFFFLSWLCRFSYLTIFKRFYLASYRITYISLWYFACSNGVFSFSNWMIVTIGGMDTNKFHFVFLSRLSNSVHWTHTRDMIISCILFFLWRKSDVFVSTVNWKS